MYVLLTSQMCPPVLISRTAQKMLLILQHEVHMQINTINQACPVELRKHQYNKQTEDNMDLYIYVLDDCYSFIVLRPFVLTNR